MSVKPKTDRYICIHGHFYQPPRENPWLEAIEKEESAAPYHDWNERITAECYAPNARSRIMNEKGKIAKISNNYEQISFNFGPTLLSWLDEKAGITLKGIQQADRQSQKTRQGHGNALAQAYNHIILPLAQERDLLTQVRWAKAEFIKRFSREPEGMWLPETAVDLRTLMALRQEGIQFTILAPHQAKRFRPSGQKQWIESQGDINPRRPYWCRLPNGKKIALFFYDGGLSHAIAFENLLQNGETLFNRLMSGFDLQEPGPQLVHVATDGESYGHHRPFGDMALAYALHLLEQDPTIQLTNYGWFLAHYPPQFEVEINENTSWSCSHGIERWRADCSCRLGGAEQQQTWRAPLREGLDHLKDELDLLFEHQGALLLKDPWQARDAYIQVLLDRSPEALDRFFVDQGKKQPLSQLERVNALKLLEMERHGMLMFTSCGWFFDELSGLETTQILKYACRSIQLAKDFGRDLEQPLLTYLKKAPSNLKEYGNGEKIWEVKIRPYTTDLDRVIAHMAIGSIYQNNRNDRVYCYRLSNQDQVILPQNGSHLTIGRLKVSSTSTQEEQEMIFSVLHFGGVDFQCLLKPYQTIEGYETIKREMLNLYKTASLGDVYDWVKETFILRRFTLQDLFSEERQKMIELLLQDRLENHIRLLGEWIKEDTRTLVKLIDMGVTLPKPITMALTLVQEQALQKGIDEAFSPSQRLETLQEFFRRSRELGNPLTNEQIKQKIQGKIERELNHLRKYSDPEKLFGAISKVIHTCNHFDVSLNLWNLQNIFLDACRDLPQDRPKYRHRYLTFALEIDIPSEVISWEVG
jgi:alpha-amylase/alpha-mannosidase (GH57 family)